jgi:RNA polymerase sigma factor (sigma-70 family)
MADIPLTRVSLLARLREGKDQGAWSQFVDLYAPVVFGYLRKQGLQDADAADLCQDVFAAVASAVGRLEYDPCRGAFRNWLFTIVRRKLWKWHAGRERVPGCGDTGTQMLLERQSAPDDNATQWKTEWELGVLAWASEQVRRDVSESTWQAFWRTAHDGKSGKQVAGELGMTVAAVYHARGRVVARLRELVKSVEEP